MVRIKAKVENMMGQLETSLDTDPVPMFSLRRRLSKAEDLWSEYEGLYDQLCAIQGEDLDEQDSKDFTAFHERYSDVSGHAEDALTRNGTQKKLASKQSLPNGKCNSIKLDGRQFTFTSKRPWRRSRPAWEATLSPP